MEHTLQRSSVGALWQHGAAVGLGLLVGCGHGPSVEQTQPAPQVPQVLLGDFVDDYGSTHVVTEQLWVHDADARYHITQWNPEQHYLLARNDPGNPSDGNLWTRIDWILISDGGPYTWAFCLSAYDAPTAAVAEAAHADPERPKRGCNGFPYTRMLRQR